MIYPSCTWTTSLSDAAVAAAYGWPADLPDDEILARLFALNQERAGVEQALPPAERIAASD